MTETLVQAMVATAVAGTRDQSPAGEFAAIGQLNLAKIAMTAALPGRAAARLV